jgi:hypothetical protein
MADGAESQNLEVRITKLEDQLREVRQALQPEGGGESMRGVRGSRERGGGKVCAPGRGKVCAPVPLKVCAPVLIIVNCSMGQDDHGDFFELGGFDTAQESPPDQA